MRATPIPFNEDRRQRILDQTGILDEGVMAELDALTAEAARHWSVPFSAVSLIDDDRQFFKSRVGLAPRETPRDIAFCAFTIIREEATVVADAARDPRFSENPLVTGDPNLRFYAGAPIMVSGVSLGSFCVLDTKPRRGFSGADEAYLHNFAHLASQVIEKHRLERLSKLPIGDRLRLAEEQRSATERERAAFLAMVSHELRTPLHQISGFLDLVESQARPEGAEGADSEYFTYIRSAVAQMHDLTEAALAFASADFGRTAVERAEFVLCHALEDTAQSAASEIDLAAIAGVRLHACEAHFRQLFLSIAVALSPPGTRRLRVCAGRHSEGDVTVDFVPDGDASGSALTESCFEPFGSGEDIKRRGQEGFRLGLAFAKRLAGMEGARLSLAEDAGDRRFLRLDIPATLISAVSA